MDTFFYVSMFTAGFAAMCAGICFYYKSSIDKMISDRIKHVAAVEDLSSQTRLKYTKELNELWVTGQKAFLNIMYLQVLDLAFTYNRKVKPQGWALKISREVLMGDDIDLSKYLTDDELTDLMDARNLYGEDARMTHFDKVFRL